jgi:hypothetical protein
MKVVHKQKVNTKDIISGTETEADIKDNVETKEFMKKFEEYKKNYMKDRTTKDMVYENGSALALLYKEIGRLNSLLMSNLQKKENEQKTESPQ